MLEYIIRHIARYGFNEIALNLHVMPDIIRCYFGDGSNCGVKLTYSYETDLLGTAGGVKNMEHFLRHGDSFLVSYGDVLTDQDLSAMLSFHRERRALATLLLHRRAASNSVVSMDADGRITEFLERPDEQTGRAVDTNWVNSGICVCAPEMLDSIPAGVPCDLPRDIFPKLLESERLYGFPLSGYRCAIDSPDRLSEAKLAVAEGRCRVPFLKELGDFPRAETDQKQVCD